MARVLWFGDAVASQIEKKLLDDAETWMRVDVETDAKEHCPVDSGDMRNSHTVQRGNREVVLGVGGPSVPYATKQHEDAALMHTVGEDHWLEKAFERQKPKLITKLKGGVL